jgi:hypothetical protein
VVGSAAPATDGPAATAASAPMACSALVDIATPATGCPAATAASAPSAGSARAGTASFPPASTTRTVPAGCSANCGQTVPRRASATRARRWDGDTAAMAASVRAVLSARKDSASATATSATTGPAAPRAHTAMIY